MDETTEYTTVEQAAREIVKRLWRVEMDLLDEAAPDPDDEYRVRLEGLASCLREHYPQATIEQAALIETDTPPYDPFEDPLPSQMKKLAAALAREFPAVQPLKAKDTDD